MASNAGNEVEEFVCIDLLPPSQDQDAVRAALNENPANGIHSSGPYMPPTQDGTGKSEDLGLPTALVINVTKRWAIGRVLQVKFLGGDQFLRERVKKFALQWTHFANIKFEWLADDAAQSDIRVDFVRGGGHNSYVGTDNIGIAQDKRTMNLDINNASTDDEVRRVSIHEFGHAIGCEHEHQSPKIEWKWNEEVVLRKFGGYPNFWDEATIRHNILNRAGRDGQEVIYASEFDPSSIMCYAFSKELFMPGAEVPTNHNTQLSKRDKDLIAIAYPHNSSDVGLFSTMQVRPWDAPATARDESVVAFLPVYQQPPRLALGLTWLDLAADKYLSVLAEADEVANDSFTVSIGAAKGAAHIYSAAASWLEVAAHEAEILVGTQDFTAPGVKSVNFNGFFNGNDPVTVVAFLTGFELGKDGPWKLKTFATNVSPFKFKLNVEAGEGVEFRSAKVTYVAFPRGKQGITAGTFSTTETRGLENAGSVSFDGNDASFASAPQLFTVVSGFDFNNGHNLRLRLTTSLVEKTGFGWNFDSWYDSELNSATAAYVAVLPPKPSKVGN